MVKLFFIFVILLFITIYFIPSFIAIGRKHKYLLQITILNAFLGWSFIAWVAALIWGTTNYTEEETPTKSAWIIIAAFAILSISPILLYSLIPAKYKTSVIEETQYKKVIYTNDSGKQVKQEKSTKHIGKF